MIREAIQKIQDMVEATEPTFVVDGRTYNTKTGHMISPPRPEPVNVRTLRAVVDYVKGQCDKPVKDEHGPLIIHVVDANSVNVLGRFDVVNGGRARLLSAVWPDLVGTDMVNWKSQEEFLIGLRTRFVATPARDQLIKVASSVGQEDSAAWVDDGITQTVTAKTGQVLRERAELPPSVLLTGRRTFPEVDQPESEYVFRARKGPHFRLFESDGGAWEVDAILRIGVYLNVQLGGLGVTIIS